MEKLVELTINAKDSKILQRAVIYEKLTNETQCLKMLTLESLGIKKSMTTDFTKFTKCASKQYKKGKVEGTVYYKKTKSSLARAAHA